jgi:hypothetical protein
MNSRFLKFAATVPALNRSDTEDLKILHLGATCISHLDDEINRRANIKAQIDACNENGFILCIESGRDCDGVEYSGLIHGPIPATLLAYYQLLDSINDWADGPFRVSICRPSSKAAIKYTSRDRTLEAFEDGHPHCIYSSF